MVVQAALCGMCTEIPKWLIVFVYSGWLQHLQILHFLRKFLRCYFQLQFRLLFNTRNFSCRLWYWRWGFNMGAVRCYPQRAHGVLVADGNICLPCKFSIRLTFSGFLRAQSSTKQPSLYFFFTNGMRVICIIGEEDSIFFYSFRSSVHELCSTCFQISHIACPTQRGAVKCVMTWSGKLSM